MRVRITKSSKPSYWYAKHIGKTFDAEIETKVAIALDHYKVKDPEDNSEGWIIPEDCEIIEDTEDTKRDEILTKLSKFEFHEDTTFMPIDKWMLDQLNQAIIDTYYFKGKGSKCQWDYIFTIQEINARKEELRTDLVDIEELKNQGYEQVTLEEFIKRAIKHKKEGAQQRQMLERDGTERREWKDWHKHNNPEKIQDAIDRDCAIAALQNVYLIGSELE